jgi:hypothetical protein
MINFHPLVSTMTPFFKQVLDSADPVVDWFGQPRISVCTLSVEALTLSLCRRVQSSFGDRLYDTFALRYDHNK